MSTRNLAQSLDHFVVPVDDLIVAEEFYTRVFGGVITKRNGPGAKWQQAPAHLETLGIENGDRGAAKERTGEQGGTSMDDPAGYVIQFITDGME